MKFTPRPDEDRKYELIPAGTYQFEVVECSEGVSKAGNPMFSVTLDIFKGEDRLGRVWDYVLATDDGMWKLRHLCDACGILKNFEAGEVTVFDLEHRSGQCEITIRKGNAQYPGDKNAVKDYVKRSTAPEAGGGVPETVGSTPDDGMPF